MTGRFPALAPFSGPATKGVGLPKKLTHKLRCGEGGALVGYQQQYVWGISKGKQSLLHARGWHQVATSFGP